MTTQLQINYKSIVTGAFIFLLTFLLATSGCKKTDTATAKRYQQVNLVSDVAGYGAARVDANLTNAWGISIGPTGSFWISANHSGSTVVYDRSGAQLLAPVNIPLGADLNGSSPTGVVYNGTSDFVISTNSQVGRFIYSTEDGIISAWSSGISAVTVADQSSSNTVYKGLALASVGSSNFLYASDFHNGKVDVYDSAFNLVHNKPFVDPNIPAGFAPFNIQNIGGQLYVSYAKQKGPDNTDDLSGTGNGYINIFSPSGVLVKRFASQGSLNSPWGIVKAPVGFGQVESAILIGNFGDGKISVFDANGSYQGQLKDSINNVITIDGLWALNFPQNGIPSGDQNQLFFTAGPGSETHGLFGYVKVR